MPIRRILIGVLATASFAVSCGGGSAVTIHVETQRSCDHVNRFGDAFVDLTLREAPLTEDLATAKLSDGPMSTADGGCTWTYLADRSIGLDKFYLANGLYGSQQVHPVSLVDPGGPVYRLTFASGGPGWSEP